MAGLKIKYKIKPKPLNKDLGKSKQELMDILNEFIKHNNSTVTFVTPPTIYTDTNSSNSPFTYTQNTIFA